MAIPRFNAQIGGIQIPSMKNYQEEENAEIAKSLGKFGSDILSISTKIAFNKEKLDSEYYELYKKGTKISSKDGVGV